MKKRISVFMLVFILMFVQFNSVFAHNMVIFCDPNDEITDYILDDSRTEVTVDFADVKTFDFCLQKSGFFQKVCCLYSGFELCFFRDFRQFRVLPVRERARNCTKETACFCVSTSSLCRSFGRNLGRDRFLCKKKLRQKEAAAETDAGDFPVDLIISGP